MLNLQASEETLGLIAGIEFSGVLSILPSKRTWIQYVHGGDFLTQRGGGLAMSRVRRDKSDPADLVKN